MGGAVSIPTTSQSTKSILEFILRELFRRADLADLYSLADPTRCKAYIVATGDALNKVFATQMITPKRGKGGIIYFQRIQAIQGNEEIKKEHDQNCVKLAFYFIRIFQIYGALALSVLDTEIPQTNLMEFVKLKPQERQAGIAPPAVQGFQQRRSSYFGFGGALPQPGRGRDSRVSFYITNPTYGILNKYLDPPDTNEDTESPLYFHSYPGFLFIPQDSMYTTTAAPFNRVLKAPFQPIVVYSYRSLDGTKELSANLEVSLSGTNLTAKLSNFSIARVVQEGKMAEEVLERSMSGIFKTQTDKELPAVIIELFEKMMPAQPFSVVKFLKDWRYISTVDSGDQRIGSTNLFIQDPKEKLKSGSTVPVEYRKSVTIDKKSLSVVLRFKLSITQSPDQSGNKKRYIVSLDLSRESIQATRPSSVIDYILSSDKYKKERKTVLISSGGSEPKNEKEERFPTYIDRVLTEIFENIKRGETYGDSRVQYTREGIVKPYDSSTMPEPLKIKSLWDALARKPPVKAHCVARALQLLSVAGIRADATLGPVYSDACRSKFLLEVDHSLPVAGSSITSSYGIAALNNLFFDSVDSLTPNISNNPNYKMKMLAMRKAFEGTEDQPDAMKEIKSVTCSSSERIDLSRDAATAAKLRKVVNALLSRQKAHVSAVVYLLGKMFDMPQIKKGVFYINPRVISGGMDEVNKIGEEARDLLLKYYEGCETDFKSGLVYISAKLSPSAAAAAAAPDVPNNVNANDTSEVNND